MRKSVEGAYFFAWGELRRLLRSHGVPSKDCDAERKKIHAEVTGSEKSHNDFTKDETDDVIARFRELSGAIQKTDFKRGRRLYVIRQICRSMGKPEAYAQGVADQMDFDHERPRREPGQTDGEFEVAKWEAELHRDRAPHHRPLAELSAAELDDVIVALRKYEQRGVIAEPVGAAVEEGDPF